jgi:CBS-domain-containing membrane protein
MKDKEKNPRFYLIDHKFKRNKGKYIVQCLMAAVSISAILIFLDTLFNSAVLAAFGATSFIVFAMPQQKTSNPRRLIGGYIVGIAVGVGMRSLESLLPSSEALWLVSLFGALAVAISIFIMTMTNTEHPPAAGAALGIALDGIEPMGILIMLLAVGILVAIKYALRRWMINLFE